MRYDAILNERYHVGNNSYRRLSKADMEDGSPLSEKPIKIHQEEMFTLIKDVVDGYKSAYGIPANPELEYLPFKELDAHTPKNEVKQVEAAVKEFGNNFRRLISRDNGKVMVKIVEQAVKNKKLTGMGSKLSLEERLRKKQMGGLGGEGQSFLG